VRREWWRNGGANQISLVDFSAKARWIISVIVMTGVGKVWMAAADVP
jgi:hypothetical protein